MCLLFEEEEKKREKEDKEKKEKEEKEKKEKEEKEKREREDQREECARFFAYLQNIQNNGANQRPPAIVLPPPFCARGSLGPRFLQNQ